MKSAIAVPRSRAQSSRQLLEAKGLWDKSRKLEKYDSSSIAIPVLTDNLDALRQCLQQETNSITLVSVDLPSSKVHSMLTPAQSLKNRMREFLKSNQTKILPVDVTELLSELPCHWEKHADMILLPSNAFVSPVWYTFGEEVWRMVATCLGAERLARQAAVMADDYRSPQVEILLGSDPVVRHVDNGITYEFDVTCCMFSIGNITEKLRVASFNCEGETVVDLYAGIGYFTLPYLVHARAKHVHACEWNPYAIKALRRNLVLNNVAERCTIHEGDNRQLLLKGVADRVNLGLIPSSEDGWPVACQLLKASGGIMHVHGNVNTLTAVGEKLLISPQDKTLAEKCENEGSADTNTIQGTQFYTMPRVVGMVKQSCNYMEACDQSEGASSLLRNCPNCQSSVGNEKCLCGCHWDDRTSHSSMTTQSGKAVTDVHVTRVKSDSHTVTNTESNANWRRVNENYAVCSPTESCAKPKIKECTTSSCICTSKMSSHEHVDKGQAKYGACVKTNQKHTEISGKVPVETGSDEGWASQEGESYNGRCKAVRKHQQDGGLRVTGNVVKEKAWHRWGATVCCCLKALLEKEKGGQWETTVLHVEPVKSYAPHVYHVVLDIACAPVSSGQ